MSLDPLADNRRIKTRHRPPFSLVRRFAVFSLIAIAFASAISATVLSGFLRKQMLDREAHMMMDVVNGVIAVEFGDRKTNGPVDWLQGDLAAFFYHIGGLPDVLKANVYRPDGTIVWSTDRDTIGQRFARNGELDAAFTGSPIAHINAIGAPGDSPKEEYAFLKLSSGAQFIESYLPVFTGRRGEQRVVGVIEIYNAPKALFATIETGIRRVWQSAAAGALIIYVMLFGIVLRANQTILRQQNEIASSDMLAAVGEMASVVAHSLRNPLSSVRSSAELALTSGNPALKDAALNDILRNADRLELWIRQYLADTQTEAGRDNTADVRASIEQTLGHFARSLSRAGIRTHIHIGPDLPPVRPSSLTLTQVLHGLVANALEAMPGGGTLSIWAATEEAGERVRIQLQDTGTGLADGGEINAFKPFMTTKQSGFGLGLPLARRVVARYGGQLTLANRPDRGAVATLLLPTAG